MVTGKDERVPAPELRRLRELHPEVQIKVLYQRDYLHLLVKYGLEPPEQLGDLAGVTPQPLDLRPEVGSKGASEAESA